VRALAAERVSQAQQDAARKQFLVRRVSMDDGGQPGARASAERSSRWSSIKDMGLKRPAPHMP
jgi:hypothetical protein